MKIILCVTGSIAAVETVKLARELRRMNHDVQCFMSEHACEIITPYTMEFATNNPVITKITGQIEHVKNAQADLILVAPATANTISKFAYKIADNPITTLLITANGYHTPILFVPSMHQSMYNSIEENINKIKENHENVTFLQPKQEENKAKFPYKHDICLEVERQLHDKQLKGKKVIVNTGATFEEIDSMRGITNRSSGKMGVELANQAYIQGADVTLICGKIHTHVPHVYTRIDTESTKEMMDVTIDEINDADIYISAAAVSDFKVKNSFNGKISSVNDINIEFTKLPKILGKIKEINPNIFLVGFKAESNLTEEKLIEKALNRMQGYGVDLMVANDISLKEAGPGFDDNEVILLYGNNQVKIPLTSKKIIAEKIMNRITLLL